MPKNRKSKQNNVKPQEAPRGSLQWQAKQPVETGDAPEEEIPQSTSTVGDAAQQARPLAEDGEFDLYGPETTAPPAASAPQKKLQQPIAPEAGLDDEFDLYGPETTAPPAASAPEKILDKSLAPEELDRPAESDTPETAKPASGGVEVTASADSAAGPNSVAAKEVATDIVPVAAVGETPDVETETTMLQEMPLSVAPQVVTSQPPLAATGEAPDVEEDAYVDNVKGRETELKQEFPEISVAPEAKAPEETALSQPTPEAEQCNSRVTSTEDPGSAPEVTVGEQSAEVSDTPAAAVGEQFVGEYVSRSDMNEFSMESILRLRSNGQWWHAAHRTSKGGRRRAADAPATGSKDPPPKQAADVQVSLWEMAECLGTWTVIEDAAGKQVVLSCAHMRWTTDKPEAPHELKPTELERHLMFQMVEANEFSLCFEARPSEKGNARRLRLRVIDVEDQAARRTPDMQAQVPKQERWQCNFFASKPVHEVQPQSFPISENGGSRSIRTAAVRTLGFSTCYQEGSPTMVNEPRVAKKSIDQAA